MNKKLGTLAVLLLIMSSMVGGCNREGNAPTSTGAPGTSAPGPTPALPPAGSPTITPRPGSTPTAAARPAITPAPTGLPASGYLLYSGALNFVTTSTTYIDNVVKVQERNTVTIPFQRLALQPIPGADTMIGGTIETAFTYTTDWSVTIPNPTPAGVSYSISAPNGRISGNSRAFVYGTYQGGRGAFGFLLQDPSEPHSESITVAATNTTASPPRMLGSNVVKFADYGQAGRALRVATLGAMSSTPSGWAAFCSTVFKNSQISTMSSSNVQQIFFSGTLLKGEMAEVTYLGNLVLGY